MSSTVTPGENVERAKVRVYQSAEEAAVAVAARIAEIIRAGNADGDLSRAKSRERTVLGLATGHTPINVYRELARMHRDEGLDLANVVTFNLDEYWPIEPRAIQSYRFWMQENFFKHVNIRPENIHIPSGTVPEEQVDAHCREYDAAVERAGGIDFQILGIGRTGHIGFNEPGSQSNSRTRRVRLDKITRKDAASDFFGEEYVPAMAITMGVGTILRAREICLLAFGEHKAPIIRRAVEGEPSADVAATFLQSHPNATFYTDEAAAEDLTRFATPWVLGPCEWDELLTRKAIIWLARRVEKPILKLTDEDYGENGLGDLLRAGGRAYDLNLQVFRHMLATITGWPGGKADPRRVLVLSPHPDDDVICMGGTLTRLVEQGHNVHVAYMASGYLSVFDHDVTRYSNFVREFNRIFGLEPEHTEAIEEHIEKFLHHKRPGDVDSREILSIKSLIRRGEALDAARYCGLDEANVHFLDLPFYDTGTVQKVQIGPRDVKPVRNLLEEVRPEMVFAAGDISDPHGTHRLCLQAAVEALQEHVAAGNGEPEIWLYRGAWEEWTPEQIDMAVPLSPDELKHKRFAIFRHESQKDRAMFPGPYDSREFWQRAEERNMTTARIYDALGLPEYHAIEAFVRWPLKRPAQADAQFERAD